MRFHKGATWSQVLLALLASIAAAAVVILIYREVLLGIPEIVQEIIIAFKRRLPLPFRWV